MRKLNAKETSYSQQSQSYHGLLFRGIFKISHGGTRDFYACGARKKYSSNPAKPDFASSPLKLHKSRPSKTNICSTLNAPLLIFFLNFITKMLCVFRFKKRKNSYNPGVIKLSAFQSSHFLPISFSTAHTIHNLCFKNANKKKTFFMGIEYISNIFIIYSYFECFNIHWIEHMRISEHIRFLTNALKMSYN